MLNTPGLFIVLEGSDGSGKGTQFELLKKRLLAAGYEVEVFDFPRYDKPSSYFVTRYLNGEYGPAESINPYTASLFYALDRYEAGIDIKAALDAGKIVISNRYVGSNMAHQGSKFEDNVAKRSFFVWEDSLEFQLLNIPRPTINLFLRVPAEVSFELIKKKIARDYTSKTHDEHEANIEHLKKSVATYDLLCELFPKDFYAIDCVQNGQLLDIESINTRIWDHIAQFLPEQVVEAEETLGDEITDELNSNQDNQETAQQTLPPAASDKYNWDIKKLSLQAAYDLARLGTKVQIDFNGSWNGDRSKYDFYIPDGLSEDKKKSYKRTYQSAAEAHKKVFAALKKIDENSSTASSISKRFIPAGATFNCRVELDHQMATGLLNKLETNPLKELTSLAAQLRKYLSSKSLDSGAGVPKSNASTPKPLNEILAQLAANKLPQNLSDNSESVIVSATPRNEFDLLADSIYALSDLTREEILAAMDRWSYAQKSKALSEALKADNGLLTIANYKFDSLGDRISLLNILGFKKQLKIQQPTTRYGYDVPLELESAKVEDLFIDTYDNFLWLFNELQTETDDVLLSYATLSGHKIRWEATLSAKDLLDMTASKDKQFVKEVNRLISQIQQIHPLVGAWVNEHSEKDAKRIKQDRSKKKSR